MRSHYDDISKQSDAWGDGPGPETTVSRRRPAGDRRTVSSCLAPSDRVDCRGSCALATACSPLKQDRRARH